LDDELITERASPHLPANYKDSQTPGIFCAHDDSSSVAMIISERRENRMVGFGDDRDSWRLR
jgi:hypothetical protein